MPNVLKKEKQVAIISALAEASSMRAISRITGVHQDTTLPLGVRIGQGCAALLDAKMRNLNCRYLHLDDHGSKATHVETVPIKETFQGQTVREGDVEVFDLADHPKASRLYAWSHDTGDPDNPQHITVLQIPPATTSLRAVQVAIAGMFREAEANAES